MKLFTSKCFYCGCSPSRTRKIKRGYGEFTYNGIDRKNSSLGYTLDNCVPCCTFCNLTKSNTSFDDFILWIRTVYNKTQEININTNAFSPTLIIYEQLKNKRMSVNRTSKAII